MRVCAVCDMIRARVYRCVRDNVFVCWNPAFQLFFALLAAATAAAVSCLYHIVPQAGELSTLW